MVGGALDRGGAGTNSHASTHPGDVLTVATKDVVTVPRTTTIMSTVKTMLNREFRRIPIADAGTKQLRGIIVCQNIVDFLCGGPRHSLVTNRFGGNIIAAVNEEIREIMKLEVPHLYQNASISDALDIMKKEQVGCLPILDKEDRVDAIVTEQDFMRLITGVKTEVEVADFMSTGVTTIDPDDNIGTAGKLMVDHEFRRLPIVKNGILLGIVTAFDILRFLGSGEALTKGAVDIAGALSVPAKSLIEKDIVWTTSGVDLGDAVQMMVTNGVGSLPIIDQGVFTGILTERDVVGALSTLK